MKRYEAKKGLLSCWECGSGNVFLFSRVCNRQPSEPLTSYMYTIQCGDCGCSTGCHCSAKDAVEGWNAAYSTKEEVEKLQEFDYAVFVG